MTESPDDASAQEARHEPQVLANIVPSIGQRRMARAFVVALLAIFAGTWPLRSIQLPAVDAFLPAVAGALSVADCVASALLYAQFAILGQCALLIIANGYLFSALMVVGHALAFPGVFTPHGFLVVGTGLQSSVWIYWFWHSALILSFIGYALFKDGDYVISASSTPLAIGISVVAVFAAAVGLYWFATRHENLLPITFVDVRPISLFRHLVGGVSLLTVGAIALCLLWVRRRSLLDQWLMVALCALLLEVLIVSAFAVRYDFGWYAGRFYQLLTATIVMVVLLAEMTNLYANLARSNMMLQNERLMLQRALQAQRREREARLATGDAVAAMIAHEVKQPLSAMITRSDTGLRWLDRAIPDLDKAKAQFRQIAADGHRAGAVIESIRANFRKDAETKTSLDVNELIAEALASLRDDLQRYQILIKAEPNAQLPQIVGDRIQLHQVLINLISNAVDAMKANERPRILSVGAEVRNEDAVVVSVADNGIGISPQDIERIFSPRFTTKSGGMGMGLAICRSILEAHDGQLWAASNTPVGAVFQFALRTAPAASIVLRCERTS